MVAERGPVRPDEVVVADVDSRPLSDELIRQLTQAYAVLKVTARPLLTEWVMLKDRLFNVSERLNFMAERAEACLIAMGVPPKEAERRVKAWRSSVE